MMISKNKTHRHSPGKGFLSQSLQNESGAALIVALLLMMVMIIMVPVALQLTTGEIDRTANFKDDRKLFYLAEAGLEHGKSVVATNEIDDLLAGPDGDPTTLGDNGTVAGMGDTADATPFTWNGIPYDDVAFINGTYYFRAYDNDDGDADLYTDSDGLVFIDGVGVNANGDVKTLRALTRRSGLFPSTFPAAMTMTGPITIATSQGTAFRIYGAEAPSYTYGAAIDGTEDPSCPGVSAVAAESPGPIQTVNNINQCTDATCLQFGGSQWNKWYGTGGAGDDFQTDQTQFTGSDAEDMWTQFTAPGVPDSTTATNVLWAGNQTIGSAASPVILHFQSNLLLTGDTTGYGVLVVDGTLTITGTMNWNGIILVGSCPTCNGDLAGTGHSDIYGALVVGNSTSSQSHLNGDANIHYSCEGIAIANSVFPNPFFVVSWNEVD